METLSVVLQLFFFLTSTKHMFGFLNKFVRFPFVTFLGLLSVAVLANMYTGRNDAEAACFNANCAGLFIGSDFRIHNHEYLHCKVDSVVSFYL